MAPAFSTMNTDFLRPLKTLRRRKSLRKCQSTVGKRLLQQQTNENTLPQVARRGNRRWNEASCARRRKQGHHAIENHPQQKQQTFSSRKDNFASNPRRREKLLTAGEGGKLDHQHQSSTRASSARFQPLTFGTAVGAGVLRRHARSRQLYILRLANTGSLA